jgi:amidase
MTSVSTLMEMDGTELANLLRGGEVTSREAVEAAIRRAEEVNPTLNAIVLPRYEKALDEAEAWTPGRIREADGPFPGVPFLLKDLLAELEGHPITSGSRLLRSHLPSGTSEIVERYRSAGLVVMGSTNTPEFGLQPVTEPMAWGPCRNPWDPDRTPGGSSGGSGAAVAAGIVPLAGGGDGGGSLRIPASCCGIFGLKPTRGRTPSGPNRAPPWRGFAVQHVLTRSIRDSAALLDWIGEPEVGAPSWAPPPQGTYLEAAGRDPKPLRIAWTADPVLGSRISPEAREALDGSLRLLEELGHDCDEVILPVDGEAFSQAFRTAVSTEVATELADIERRTGRRGGPGNVEPPTWALALVGRALPGHRSSLALSELELSAGKLVRFLDDWDVLVTPTVALPPLRIGEFLESPWERLLLSVLGRLRAGGLLRALGLLEKAAADAFDFIPWLPLFNVTGQPAMSVPLHWTEGGLPMGTHVVGRFGDEETLFSLAGQLERARPWSRRRPGGPSEPRAETGRPLTRPPLASGPGA